MGMELLIEKIRRDKGFDLSGYKEFNPPHRALKEGGILWMGTAESLSAEAQKLFEPIYNRKHAV